MRKRVSTIVLILSWLAVPAAAQMPPDSMPIVVRATDIGIGPERVPRFLDLPRVLTVPATQVVELAADSIFDYIEVAGTLKCSRTHDTRLRFIHFFVLPGGRLDCGTVDVPIPPGVHVEFIFRDVPIDLTRDPFQWGNALLNFGTETRVGAKKLAWAPLVAELAAGATTITLDQDPDGWVTGDKLLIVDTAQPTLTSPIRLETEVSVASISGRVVTLSKPLDFEHLAQREPDGTIVLYPRVANLTRNIVLHSEGQTTPGHVADVGHMATFDIRYNEIDFLGRTKAQPLENTNADASHIGTNEKGRYGGLHAHHVMGFGSIAIGNVARGVGAGGTKWGFAAHDTSDARWEDNVCFDFAGACFVTEDGPEVRNTFRRNFAAYVPGTNVDEVNEALLVTNQNPGSSGSCFWFRGLQNIIEGNEGWDCAFGMALVQSGGVSTIAYPSQPGGMADTLLNIYTAIPMSFANNVTASNQLNGLEYWSTSRFPAINHTSSYNGRLAFQMGQSDPAAVLLVNPSFIGKYRAPDSPDGPANGMHSSMAYVGSFEISGGGRVVGFLNGLMGGGGVEFTKVSGTPDHPLRMQNVINLELSAVPRLTLQDNVLHVKLPGYPEQFTVFSRAEVWDGQPPLPNAGATYFATQRGSQHLIKNWQGTGKDYRLIFKQALGSFAAWFSQKLHAGDPDYHVFNVPEQGLTNAQAWAKYGMAYGGEEIDQADVVPLVGIINGFARVDGPTKFGPPRAVMTFPNAWSTPPIEGDATDHFVQGYGVMTGDPAGTSDLFLFSLDGGPWVSLQQSEFSKPGARSFGLRNLSEGLHEVRTRRADLAGVAILSSELLFHYSVGPVVTPPPVVLCTDQTATNVGKPLPCTFPPPPQLCMDPIATNFGGLAPCVFPPPPQLCADPRATNVGAPLPCVFPPPPPVETWALVSFLIERFGTTNRYRVTLGGVVIFEFSRP